MINKGPVELTLRDGTVVHTRATRKAWLELHDVELTPPAPP